MPRDRITRLRELCLALPEAHEVEAWGTPTFRVRNKIFAMYASDLHGDGRVAVWCKATPADQDLLVHAFPERFFVPPYVGPRGWLGVRLDRSVRWTMVRDLVTEAYRMTAPKRLLARLDGDGA
ncbi:MAG TPA: MmcQ/YjbR family DNA-binding protein [Gemmatimonadaceae bacterium]